MKAGNWLLLAALHMTIAASAQDWQHCKPDGGGISVAELKDSVHSVAMSHGIDGWDMKRFSRSGDLTSFAIVQTLTVNEMTFPQTLENVLYILRVAFACTSPCGVPTSESQPRVALLLLEHLHNITSGKMQSNIDETRKYIQQQARSME